MSGEFSYLFIYNKLYNEGKSSHIGFEGVEWSLISNSLAKWVIRPFDEEEIQRTIFEGEGNKAPGPDGYSMGYFQILRSSTINLATSETYICPIAKKLNSCKIDNYRLISLLTSLYNVITKFLLTKLKGALEDRISIERGEFIAGKQILGVVLTTNEVVEDYRRLRTKCVVFKIDFEKVYDNVEWDFLDFVLERK